MRTAKNLLYYGAIIAIVIFITPTIWAFFSRLTKGQLTEITTATAVDGRVTKCDSNNHNFLWCLNDKQTRYDFGVFDGANAFTRAQQAKLPAQNGTGLRYYLAIGDVLHKQANSPILRVQRGNIITLWTCAEEANPNNR